MSDEQPKKVVRRVVKKTVVRPVSDVGREERPRVAAPGRPATPRTRTVTNPHTGRTVTLGGTTKTPPVAKAGTPVEPATPAKVAKPSTPRRSPRDVLDDWRLAAADRTSGAARVVRSGAGAVGSGARSGSRRVLSVRLPHWPGARGVVATSLVTGLVVVALGALALQIFDMAFGVKSGGAWGVLAFALIGVAAFAVSRTVLGWFGNPSASVIAMLAQLLGVVLLLVALPTNTQSLWSLVIVPVVSVLSHLGAYAGALLADAEAAGSEADLDDEAPATQDRVAAR